MGNIVVRLSSLTLKNIKNVKNGIIIMPLANERKFECSRAEILGIYGQNGSGKTAIVDALYFLQGIITGEELDQRIIDYIDTDSTNAEINAEFKIFGDNVLYEVGYHIIFSKIDDGVIIEREYLNCAINKDGNRTNKNVFMDYQRTQTDVVFKPLKRVEELVGKDKNVKMDLIVARKIAEKSNCSYIFGKDSREIFFKKNSEFKNYSIVIHALFDFALKDLFVIRSSHSGLISANFLLPMAFRIEKEKTGMKGDFAVPLMEPVILDIKKKDILNEIKDYGKQAMDSGEEGWKVELMSNREGKRTIPIRMESEGIIKIVSILNVLIQAFGNSSICLVIDELDAGIFEYMLGELLDIFNKSAKGQLIFTSHNLRALEMLDKDSIMFSTANPNNRYIHMKNVKGSNNLRSMYIRSITLGGQEEKIYEETDSLKIARAFRKAGRRLQSE